MNAADNIHCLDYAAPALQTVADNIIARCETLPDLSGVQIIVREPNLAPYLRRALLNAAAKQQQHALLGVNITSLSGWLAQFIPPGLKLCSEQIRLLILVDALQGAPDLLGQANPWNLAESLLALFDELTLNQIDIESDSRQFEQRLATLYQIPQTRPGGLQHEAQLIHRLWHAWHTQLAALEFTDPTTAQLMAMQASLDQLSQYHQVHLIGIEPLYRAQQGWLRQMLATPNVHLWLQGITDHNQADALTNHYLSHLHHTLDYTSQQTLATSDYQHLLTTLFNPGIPLLARAQQQKQDYPVSALANRLRIFSAHNAEQEATAIDIQIRKWLLEGKQAIAVVTENRLQARRLRALLERADVQLQDVAGWALSTTRAAATLESLLICIEEDFPKDPLLDLLKSPLFLPGEDHEQRKNLIYRLEHDIIQQEKIARNLQHYKQAVRSRYTRLQEIWPISPDAVLALLNQLDEATQALRKLTYRQHELDTFVQQLLATLEQLGMVTSLGDDAAGYQILQILSEMQEAARHQPLQSYWSGMRAWLGRNLEEHYFQPQHTGSPVQLLSLAQTDFQQFDALIIAGMEQDYFPGSMPSIPFFNSTVRKQLGLPDIELFRAARLRHFHRLLFSAPAILLTHRQEQDAQVIITSPWLSAIVSFHQLAYQDDLQDALLHAYVSSNEAMVFRCDTTDLPARQTQPRPVLQPDRIPSTFSASSYQQLIDCPYQFYAAHYLQLSPPEEIRELLTKREYGERIHQCLQAFHTATPNLPGPFPQPITAENRQSAIDLLEKITQAVFSQDLEENYLHRGWYHRWHKVIPEYIDWQIEQNKHAQVHLTEQKLERELAPQIHIKGRIDRIDVPNDNTARQAILDYKTGSIPTKTEIFAAEKIQLPFYASLSENDTQEVCYLPVGTSGEVRRKFPITDQGLTSLKTDSENRLLEIVDQMRSGHALPAWENEDICQYCNMIMLCRCGSWQ